jgi:hypothetical protein
MHIVNFFFLFSDCLLRPEGRARMKQDLILQLNSSPSNLPDIGTNVKEEKNLNINLITVMVLVGDKLLTQFL